MAKFDSEDLLLGILQIMTTGLNTKVAAIEAEKVAKSPTQGLTPTLASFASNNYYLQTWTDKILQNSPAIFYGIEDVQTLDGAGVAAKTYKVFVEVVYVDSGQTNDAHKRISRYSRALEELFEENFRGTLQEVHDHFNKKTVKGEIVIVVEGKP